MNSAERARIAMGYIEYTEVLSRHGADDSPIPEELESAYSSVRDLVRDGPSNVAWELVLEVLRRAPDEDLDKFAAGPLEDLVRKWGGELVDLIEDEASRDERFRAALGYIWLLVGDVPANVLARFVQASGGRIQPLDDHGLLRHL